MVQKFEAGHNLREPVADKLSFEAVEAAMAAETWCTAEEAKAAGFVDELTGGAAKAMKLPAKLGFKNAP